MRLRRVSLFCMLQQGLNESERAWSHGLKGGPTEVAADSPEVRGEASTVAVALLWFAATSPDIVPTPELTASGCTAPAKQGGLADSGRKR